MAKPIEIPVPLSSGSLDYPDAPQSSSGPQPPPLPEGYSAPEAYEDVSNVSQTKGQPPPVPEGYSAPEEYKTPASHGASGSWEPESTTAKVWRKANTPLLPAGRAEKEGRAYAEERPVNMDHPLWAGAKAGLAGTYADTLETARQMGTSPLGIATIGLGKLAGAVPGAIGKIAKAGSRLAGVGFGAQGAEQTYEGAKSMYEEGITPENVKQVTGGAGQAILGGTAILHGTRLGNAGVGEVASAAASKGVRGAGKLYNAGLGTATHVTPITGALEGLVRGGPAGAAVGAVTGGIGGKILSKIPRAPKSITEFGIPEYEQATTTQRSLVGEKQKAFDKAKADMDAYKASVVAGQPVPEKVLSAYDKASKELTEQQGHLDLAEQHAANMSAGRESVPNEASGVAPEGVVGGAEQFAPKNLPEQPAATEAVPEPKEFGEQPTRETALGSAQFAPENLPAQPEPNTPLRPVGERHGSVGLGSALGEYETAGPRQYVHPETEPASEATAGMGSAMGETKPVTPLGTALVEPEVSGKNITVKPTSTEKLRVESDIAQRNQAEAAEPKPYAGEERRNKPLADTEGVNETIARDPDLNRRVGDTKPKPFSKEAAEQDTILHQRARAELGPDASGSDVADRAQQMKNEAPKYRRPDPFATTEGANETVNRDPALNRRATDKVPKAAAPAAAPKATPFDSKQFAESHNSDGGHTWNPKYGNPEGQKGLYSVGGGEELGPTRTTIPSSQVTPEQIQEYADRPDVKAAMAKDPNRSIGTYEHDGKTELEVSQIYTNEAEAIAAGKANGEESIRDHGIKDNIPTGGTKGVSPVEAKAEPEAPKEAPKAAEVPKGEAKSSPEDVQQVHNIVKDLRDQKLITAGKQYDVDHTGYNFDKRTEATATSKGRGRYERDAMAAETTKNIPEEMKQKLIKAEQEFEDTDSFEFSKQDRSNASRAQRAEWIWDKAHEPGYGEGNPVAEHTSPRGPAPEPEAAAEPTVTRAPDFKDSGEYDVKVGDKSGKMYRDPENGYWYQVGNDEHSIGFNKADATAKLTERLSSVPKEAAVTEHMAAKGPAPAATPETAKMSNEELLKHGYTQDDIDAGLNFPKTGGGGPGKNVTGIPDDMSKFLTPEERAGISKSQKGADSAVNKLLKLPKIQEFVDIALQGEGGRKWYQRSSQAFEALKQSLPEYFKEAGDKDKFINLLASGSPQQTVKMNLQEALHVWSKYVDMERPTGKTLEKMLNNEFTLPEAKTPNAMKALAGEEMWPDISKNRAFKAPSFAANLRGWLNHVTSDGWQALFGGMTAGELSRPSSYHPLSVATRAAAEALGWEPAEAQAAIWAFTKSFREKGVTSPEEIRSYSKDFADIIEHDPDVQKQLKELGVNQETLNEYLAKVEPKPQISGRTLPTTEDSIGKLSKRIEAARGKGKEPLNKDQSNINFDEETEFNPEELEKPEVKAETYPEIKKPVEFGKPKKKTALGKAR